MPGLILIAHKSGEVDYKGYCVAIYNKKPGFLRPCWTTQTFLLLAKRFLTERYKKNKTGFFSRRSESIKNCRGQLLLTKTSSLPGVDIHSE